MKQPTILEGPWEEIRKHDSELAGQYVRLQVLSRTETSASGNREASLAEKFAGRIGTVSFEPTDIAETAEKYLAQGFGESSITRNQNS